jgi:hypothetical protein
MQGTVQCLLIELMADTIAELRGLRPLNPFLCHPLCYLSSHGNLLYSLLFRKGLMILLPTWICGSIYVYLSAKPDVLRSVWRVQEKDKCR